MTNTFSLLTALLFLMIVVFSVVYFLIIKSFGKGRREVKKIDTVSGYLVTMAFVLLIFSFYAVNTVLSDFKNNGNSFKDSYEISATFGSILSGVMLPFIGIATAIVGGLAFYMQYQANQEIKAQFLKQEEKYRLDKFENRLFKLIENYNNTVNQFKSQSRESDEIFTGKDFFFIVHQEFKATLKDVQNFNKLNSYLCKDIHIEDIEKNSLYLTELKISYSIVFYGVSEHGQKTIIERLKTVYNPVYLERLTNFLSYKPANFSIDSKLKKEWLKICPKFVSERCKKQFIRYNNGHQSRLGHYYRQLYMIIRFINDEKQISYFDKWEHSKYLRSLFSNHEQIIFYLNSISVLGHDWESSKDNIDEQWVTKYDLIKNIPDSYRNKYYVDKIYPDVEYEGQPETENRKKLNLIYI